MEILDIQAVRRKRLRQLVEDRFNGVSGQLADTVGRPRPNISQALSGARPCGEVLARAIEQKLGLAYGWLDRESDASDDIEQVIDGYQRGGAEKRSAMKNISELSEEDAAVLAPMIERLKSKYPSK